MIEKLDSIGAQILQEVEQASSTEALEKIRVSSLGKKGSLSEVLKALGSAPPAERPKIGAAANVWKSKIEGALQARMDVLQGQELAKQIQSERIDVTLPSRLMHKGALHPVTQTTKKIIDVFSRLGFEVTTGPEAETEYLCFEAVNIAADHPARDMQDTFYLGPGTVLRTHTTGVQMRTMLSQKWPVRILSPGAVYRCDSDATHSPMFHQIEGLWVDQGVRMSDLKGTLEFFIKELFGSQTKMRMRPSYFPFVEPGVEVDMGWTVNGQTKWLEILGAGMVHPGLYKAAGYEDKDDFARAKSKMSGFAFGIGIERTAMLLYGINDMRLLFQNDVRFLKQF